jgi:hypothetical protein
VGQDQAPRARLASDLGRLLPVHVSVLGQLGPVVQVGRLEQREVGSARMAHERVGVRAIGPVDERGGAVGHPHCVAGCGVPGRRERHLEAAHAHGAVVVVLVQVEALVHASGIGAERRDHLGQDPSARLTRHVQRDPPVLAEALAQRLARHAVRERNQVEHVVLVHVRDHDPVQAPDQPGAPERVEGARPAVQQQRAVVA